MAATVRPHRRVKRGENYYPMRYWSAFMLSSLLVHVLTLTSLSDVVLSLIQELSRPQTAVTRLLYIGVIYQPPAPLQGPSQASVDARSVKPVRQALPRRSSPPPEQPPPAPRFVPPFKSPEKVPEEARPADTAGLDNLEEGSIVVIKGTEKTIQVAVSQTPSPPYVSGEVAKPPFAAYTSGKALNVPPLPVRDTPPDPMDNRTSSAGFARPVIAAAHAGDASGKAEPSPATVPRTDTPILPSYNDITSIVEGRPLLSDKASAASPAPQVTQEDAHPPIVAEKVMVMDDIKVIKPEPPKVKITRPPEGDTDQGLVDVEGSVSGPGIGSVYLDAGNRRMELLVRDGSFRTTLALNEGMNVLKAVVAGASGQTATDQVSINYIPARSGPIISFTSPKENSIIDALNDREVTISGTVKGQGINAVRIYVNRTILDIPVNDGRFYRRTPLESEDNALYAEATDSSGRTSRSEEIRFRAVNLIPRDLTVRAEYSGRNGHHLLKCKWVPHPLSGKGAAHPPAPGFNVSGGDKYGLVSVTEALPGIYTIGVEYDTGPSDATGAAFEVTLYGYDPARKKARRVGPLRLQGKGYIPAVRVLLPEGVFWEDDSWFSGILESGKGTTKYKEPEGIVWKEED